MPWIRCLWMFLHIWIIDSCFWVKSILTICHHEYPKWFWFDYVFSWPHCAYHGCIAWLQLLNGFVCYTRLRRDSFYPENMFIPCVIKQCRTSSLMALCDFIRLCGWVFFFFNLILANFRVECNSNVECNYFNLNEIFRRVRFALLHGFAFKKTNSMTIALNWVLTNGHTPNESHNK